jgi:hypothetical protein
VHAQAGGVAAVEQDASAGGGHEADDHVEGGGLAGAVGAEEADDLAGADVDVNAIDDVAASVGFDEGFGADLGIFDFRFSIFDLGRCRAGGGVEWRRRARARARRAWR